jgi:hypothetical protein
MRQATGQWSLQDRAQALERLAEARANLAGLERRATPAIEPGIRQAVEEREQQLAHLREVAGRRGRVGKQARQQIEALEGTQRLVIECLGFHSYEEFAAAAARFDATRIDNRVIMAAREEVDRAERHFFNTAEMTIPVPASTPLGTAPPQAPLHAGVGAPMHRPAPRRAS